jgi:hypothetical protein
MGNIEFAKKIPKTIIKRLDNAFVLVYICAVYATVSRLSAAKGEQDG